MKLQPDKSKAPLVRTCSRHAICVDHQVFESSVIVSSLSGQTPQAWAPRQMRDLSAEDLVALSASGAEFVILGTGLEQIFPPPAWLKPFAHKRIGLECMDTAAACRTYNILASEGRRVLAALLLDGDRLP